MTKEETDLIGEAIDFYNLNHFKGQKTKKQLVGLKKRIKALTIPIVGRSTVLMKPKDWNLFQWIYAYMLFMILIVGLINLGFYVFF